MIPAQADDVRRAGEEYRQLIGTLDCAAFLARCKAGSRLLIEKIPRRRCLYRRRGAALARGQGTVHDGADWRRRSQTAAFCRA